MTPAVPIPARVLEIQARFGGGPTAPLGLEAEAAMFSKVADEAGVVAAATDTSQAGAARDTPTFLGALAPSTPPAAGSRFAGAVVDDAGVLRDDVPFAELFRAAGATHGIQPSVLAAVAKIESAFDPTAVSSAGAEGLMQFMPGTSSSMGVDPWDPASAIDGAARYLTENLRRFGSLELALAAYNAGAGAVERHGGIPPFAETEAYVPKVLAAAGLT